MDYLTILDHDLKCLEEDAVPGVIVTRDHAQGTTTLEFRDIAVVNVTDAVYPAGVQFNILVPALDLNKHILRWLQFYKTTLEKPSNHCIVKQFYYCAKSLFALPGIDPKPQPSAPVNDRFHYERLEFDVLSSTLQHKARDDQIALSIDRPSTDILHMRRECHNQVDREIWKRSVKDQNGSETEVAFAYAVGLRPETKNEKITAKRFGLVPKPGREASCDDWTDLEVYLKYVQKPPVSFRRFILQRGAPTADVHVRQRVVREQDDTQMVTDGYDVFEESLLVPLIEKVADKQDFESEFTIAKEFFVIPNNDPRLPGTIRLCTVTAGPHKHLEQGPDEWRITVKPKDPAPNPKERKNFGSWHFYLVEEPNPDRKFKGIQFGRTHLRLQKMTFPVGGEKGYDRVNRATYEEYQRWVPETGPVPRKYFRAGCIAVE